VAVPKLAVDGKIEHRKIALAALKLQANANRADILRLQRTLLADQATLFQGSSGSEGVGFLAAMFVSGEADPSHLGARSRSTGRAPYPERALSTVPALRGIATAPLRFNASRARARNIHPSIRPREVRALRGYSSA
jgi:hypothetical protein